MESPPWAGATTTPTPGGLSAARWSWLNHHSTALPPACLQSGEMALTTHAAGGDDSRAFSAVIARVGARDGRSWPATPLSG